MKVVYRADDGTDFKTELECKAYEADAVGHAERERRRKASEDFSFMVLCASKNNMGMYHLLRDRSLNKK